MLNSISCKCGSCLGYLTYVGKHCSNLNCFVCNHCEFRYWSYQHPGVDNIHKEAEIPAKVISGNTSIERIEKLEAVAKAAKNARLCPGSYSDDGELDKALEDLEGGQDETRRF